MPSNGREVKYDDRLEIRVSKETREALEVLAHADNRRLSDFLRLVLKQYVNRNHAKLKGATNGGSEQDE